jgi:hypothetical protein
MNYEVNEGKRQGKAISQDIATRLEGYVSPLLISLEKIVDKRLVIPILT